MNEGNQSINQYMKTLIIPCASQNEYIHLGDQQQYVMCGPTRLVPVQEIDLKLYNK